jgi:hypothetical protein
LLRVIEAGQVDLDGHGARTSMSSGPNRRTVVDTVKDNVKRITAAVGYAAGFRIVTMPCEDRDFVSVAVPVTKLYATPVAAFVYVAARVPVVMSIGLPFGSTNRST